MKRFILHALAFLAFTMSAHAANWQNAEQAAQFAGLAAPVSAESYFQITKQDVANAVAQAMQEKGVREHVTATPDAALPAVLYGANHPLKLTLHALQVDTQAQRWQAQAYILNGNRTELVKPVSGRFEAMLSVPVLSRQLHSGDVIEARDLQMRTMPERLLRKDTITEQAQLIGQSPLRSISAGRPIRAAEVSAPKVVLKGDLVEMKYTTPHMTIRTSGQALEDGAPGQLVRIKNIKSEKAISARVIAAGVVEVNNERRL